MPLTQEQLNRIQAEMAGLNPEEQQKKMDEILSRLPPEEIEDMKKQQCPFCMIAEGKIPSRVIYDDVSCIAVLDINPANKGHMLLFPKKHASLMTQLDDKETAHIFTVANHLAKNAYETLNAQGTNIFVANGPAAGQAAPHLLIHVIPRFEKDGISFAWKPKVISEEDMNDAFSKLKSKKISFAEKKVEKIIVEKADFADVIRMP